MLKSYALAGLALVGLGGVATAAPLPPEVCANLRAEVVDLEAKGLRATMARGPAATRATLTEEHLGSIRRLLDADAQLIFRCPRDRPYVALPPESTEETDVIEPGPDGAAPVKPAPAPAAKPKTKAAAAVAPPQAAPVQPKAKAKARPKVDDAFKPPAGAETTLSPPPPAPNQ